MLRRRTRCVYCGVRIPGSRRDGAWWQVHAARVACERHASLVRLDPRYTSREDAFQ